MNHRIIHKHHTDQHFHCHGYYNVIAVLLFWGVCRPVNWNHCYCWRDIVMLFEHIILDQSFTSSVQLFLQVPPN